MRRILKTAASTLTGLALATSIGIGTELPANAASSCNVTLTSYGTVKAGTYGKRAKAAQCLLKQAGYSVRADSSFSRTDAAKVKAFQKRVRLSQTGTVTQRTWTALLSRGSTPRLSYGTRSGSVQRLQRGLTASGRPVPATGYFGPITRAAVKSVQRSQGWRATGTATTGVWRVLQAGGAVKVTTTKAAPRAASRASASSSSSKGARALAFARAQLGDSYRFGATGPNSWDCSGLTGGAWRSVGVNLPRNSRAQSGFGQRISKSNLQKGDLVFFYSPISHVAIYAGNGKVVQASRPGRPVNVGEMKYMPYMGARRPA